MSKHDRKGDRRQTVPRRVVETEPGSDQPGHSRDPGPFDPDDRPDRPVRSMPQVPQASPAVVEPDGAESGAEQ